MRLIDAAPLPPAPDGPPPPPVTDVVAGTSLEELALQLEQQMLVRILGLIYGGEAARSAEQAASS